jgi:ubiquinone/menaquinone biosynthesis C-methylase UbiE
VYPTTLTREDASVGFFNWAAPMFHRADRRWSDQDVRIIAGRLKSFVPRGGGLLDVGGGTGGLSARLSEALDARVTVLDPTPAMVRYVPDTARVEVVLGKAEAMPLPSDGFDAVLVSDAFHHFRDQPAAVAEFARVVRPSGGVLVLDLDADMLAVRFVAGVERLLGEPGAFLTPSAMTALMARHGVIGESVRESGPSFHFLGRVS